MPFEAAEDTIVTPTYVPDLVNAVLDLLIDSERGIWHLAGGDAVSWAELAARAATAAGIGARSLRPRPLHELRFPARRPRYSALASQRAAPLPPLADALPRYLAALNN
jgi:dTDP-4-dehydrorhamnose reductase